MVEGERKQSAIMHFAFLVFLLKKENKLNLLDKWFKIV